MKGWRHGGDVWEICRSLGCSVEEIKDFSSSINPLGPPEWVYSHVDLAKPLVIHYPDPFCTRLRMGIAQQYGVYPHQVVVGNGTSELLYLLPRAIPTKRAVVVVPSYVDYEYAPRASHVPVLRIPMDCTENFSLPLDRLNSAIAPGDMVFIGRPNNPTGSFCDGETLRFLAQKNRESLFVVDQAFYDFVDDDDSLVPERPPNVLLLFSLTKMFAVPGIRIGWVVGETETVKRIFDVQSPWSVNIFAQLIGERALQDRETIEFTREAIARGRSQLVRGLNKLRHLRVYPSSANFVLVKIERKDLDAIMLREMLVKHKILIRPCENFAGLDKSFFRISVRGTTDNDQLLEALEQVMREK